MTILTAETATTAMTSTSLTGTVSAGAVERLAERLITSPEGAGREWIGQYRDVPELVAEWAFDLAEIGRLPAARRLAELTLARAPRHPSAAHAMAHVLYEEGNARGGAAFLERWLTGYGPEALDHSHLACHLAQFELWSGRPESALRVYRARLDPDTAGAGNVRLRDAAAILWRLRLESSAQALPWEALRPLAEPIVANPRCGLDAVHAAMVLAATGDTGGTARLLHALRRLGEDGQPTDPSGTAGIGLVIRLVRGIQAYGARNFDEVIHHIEPAMGDLRRLGGSNAQRTVFDEMLSRSRRAVFSASPAAGVVSGMAGPAIGVSVASLGFN